jgi:hypothetical protein
MFVIQYWHSQNQLQTSCLSELVCYTTRGVDTFRVILTNPGPLITLE